MISTAINLWNVFREMTPACSRNGASFVRCSSVVIPTAIYVAAIPFIGLYVSSMVLIALFMRWLGKYGWLMVAAVAIGMPVITYIVFEKWFLVPLPKGPLEELARPLTRKTRTPIGCGSGQRTWKKFEICFTASRSRCSRSTSW